MPITEAPRVREPIGRLLRAWRQRRGLSQLALATATDISQRHLSFVESARAMPSRELVLALSRSLEVPFRERNELLLAAGFAPIYRERALSSAALEPARAAVELVLKAYEPFPALAVDRHWTLVLANAAVAPLLTRVHADLLRPPINVLRLSLHPLGLAPHIVNLAQWREHVFSRLEAQIRLSADPVLVRLLEELRAHGAAANPHAASPAAPSPSEERRADAPLADVAIPLQIDTEWGRLSFLGTTTVFGTPIDITLSELAIEAFLPADPATSSALRALLRA
jgi:transcriptional regulator with XRE-family HTH domain